MSQIITTTVSISEDAIKHKLDSLLDDTVMKEIHALFAKTINPWVPMDEGPLSQTIEITPAYIRYIQPYSHYMYTGEVYGPNIPITKDGQIIGWFSPPGQKKNPTGRPIEYGKEKHPLATKEWDKVAMQSKLEEFEENVKNILVRRAKELYG